MIEKAKTPKPGRSPLSRKVNRWRDRDDMGFPMLDPPMGSGGGGPRRKEKKGCFGRRDALRKSVRKAKSRPKVVKSYKPRTSEVQGKYKMGKTFR